MFGTLGASLLTIGFAAGGLAFFAVYFTQRRAWWFLFPTFVLIGLATVRLLVSLGLGGAASGSVILWAVAAAFWGYSLPTGLTGGPSDRPVR